MSQIEFADLPENVSFLLKQHLSEVIEYRGCSPIEEYGKISVIRFAWFDNNRCIVKVKFEERIGEPQDPLYDDDHDYMLDWAENGERIYAVSLTSPRVVCLMGSQLGRGQEGIDFEIRKNDHLVYGDDTIRVSEKELYLVHKGSGLFSIINGLDIQHVHELRVEFVND